MESNLIKKYELIDGHIIMDMNFDVITANEEMYRFIGISKDCTLLEIIHQVDLDDFMDVVGRLKEGQERDMVLRMLRSDNSYRWMLIHISRFKFIDKMTDFDYIELTASDVIAMRKQNVALQNNLLNFRHILAMENELFFTYNHMTKEICFSNFIDSDVHNILSMNLSELKQYVTQNNQVSDDTLDEFYAWCESLESGKISFSHNFKESFIFKRAEYEMMEFKGSTIYNKNRPNMSVGSIRNLTNSANRPNVSTYEYNPNTKVSFTEVNRFCDTNILYNPHCELALVLMEIDCLDSYLSQYGEAYVDRLYDIALQTANQMVGYRGIVCEVSKNLICIAIRDINDEMYLRAFLESIRTQITWNIRLMSLNNHITFSIGAARYPVNGNDMGKINKKLNKALELAHAKGNDCYIIYKEHLHGELD